MKNTEKAKLQYLKIAKAKLNYIKKVIKLKRF